MLTDNEGAAAARPAQAPWPADKLKLVDVGGAGGLKPEWRPYASQIFPVMFEPNPNDAAALRDALHKDFAGAVVMEMGLANVTGPQTLNMARNSGCTSLRKPNDELLSKYRIGPLFRTRNTLTVECTRYDALHAAGRVPQPDAIKIDVQGFEYEVLQGFGGLLQNCLGLELETHVYPVYHGQKLMHDLVGFLADFGFVLRRVFPKANFDGDVVELDVWFTKDIAAWRGMNQADREKFGIISKAWQLLDYDLIDPAKPHLHNTGRGMTPRRQARLAAQN